MNDLLEAEWRYRYHEALGNLCGPLEPTKEQKKIALLAADEWRNWIQHENDSSRKTLAPLG